MLEEGGLVPLLEQCLLSITVLLYKTTHKGLRVMWPHNLKFCINCVHFTTQLLVQVWTPPFDHSDQIQKWSGPQILFKLKTKSTKELWSNERLYETWKCCLQKNSYLGSIGKCYTYTKESYVPGCTICPRSAIFTLIVIKLSTKLFHAEYSLVFAIISLMYNWLTASFSGLHTFTHKMWSSSQSMGLSLWNMRKNSTINGRSWVRNILPGGLHACKHIYASNMAQHED